MRERCYSNFGQRTTLRHSISDGFRSGKQRTRLSQNHAPKANVQPPGMVTVVSMIGPRVQVSLFCHYGPVKQGEIGGKQVRSKTVQVPGWQEDLL